MPSYSWLTSHKLDADHIEGKIITLRRLGVPYPDGYERQAEADLQTQAEAVAARLKTSGVDTPADREIVAVIAYLQRLGTDIKAAPAVAAAAPAGGK
jgi:cytochrome c oxidase cbb3-type subunit I/II